jgi:hypothetical protein
MDLPRPVTANEPCDSDSDDSEGRSAATCEVWQAARATSAAPYYFPDIRVHGRIMRDGGFGVNNPALQAFLHEVLPVEGDDSHLQGGVFVSIGTGGSNPDDYSVRSSVVISRQGGSLSRSGSDLSRYQGSGGTPMGSGGGPQRNVISVAQSAVNAATDAALADSQMAALAPRFGLRYFRFDVPGIRRVALDNVKGMERVKEATENYLKGPEIQDKIKRCAKRLVKNWRARK